MPQPKKLSPSLTDYACDLFLEAALAEERADVFGRAAKKIEQDGDATRAETMRHTCRKIRVQALLDRSRAGAVEVKAREDGA